jgi:ethanolamine permease
VALYILAMLALIRLRSLEPNLPRPYRTPAYPILPGVALIVASVSLIALGWYNPAILCIFLGLLGIGSAYYVIKGRHSAEKSFDFGQVVP